MDTDAILFLDTETTGKLAWGQPPDAPGQPRMIQLAAILADAEGRERDSLCLLVRPDGWEVPPDASAVHGITTDDCRRYGVPVAFAVEALQHLSAPCGLFCCHNVSFDRAVLSGEWRRLSPNPAAPVLAQPSFCTMEAATGVCRLPGGRRGFKWPTLAEAHRILCGCDFEGAHDAMADARACLRIFQELKRRGLVNRQA